MNFGEMKTEVASIIQDSSLVNSYGTWINDAILELAADFDLPTLKLVTPVSLSVATAQWLWPLAADFHKKLFKCGYYDADGNLTACQVYQHIDELAYRNHTETGDYVAEVAVAVDGDDHYLGIYPLAAATLSLWYYRKPAVLSLPEEIPDCIPASYHRRVIIPKAVLRGYQFLQDQVENFDPKPLQLWQGELARGLYGARGDSIGLINYLAKLYNPPRRHGGRDPIGGYGRSW